MLARQRKMLSPQKAKLFWGEYDAGKRHGYESFAQVPGFNPNEDIHRKLATEKKPRSTKFETVVNRARSPLRVDNHTLGTVRNYMSAKYLRWTIILINKINALGRTTKFKHLEFVPTKIIAIDRRKNRTLEQVHIGADVNVIMNSNSFEDLSKKSRYGRFLAKKIQETGISFGDFKQQSILAHAELADKIFETKIEIKEMNATRTSFVYHGADTAASNMIVIGFNKQTGKILLAAVDHGYSLPAEHS